MPKKRPLEEESTNYATRSVAITSHAQDTHAGHGKQSKSDDTEGFFRSWSWKREHRPNRDRFHKPYIHKLTIPSAADGSTGTHLSLSIRQAPFKAQGFASTVWDSSIVVAKYIERWAAQYQHKRCLDLSAGCGLVGIVLGRLGAHVTATDLAPNLPLLKQNCTENGCDGLVVLEHTWGEDVAQLRPPFDVVVACDVMYVFEAIPALVKTLEAVSGPHTQVIVAHGRNRPGEQMFMQQVLHRWQAQEVPSDELDELYQCSDVTVWQLSKRKKEDGKDGTS